MFAIERVGLGDAVERRAAEFAAGRHCAREGLLQLGIDPAAIPVGAGGAPEWPPGVTGSIAHGAGLAGAIVARSKRYLGLGLDIERRRSVTPELHHILFAGLERAVATDPDLATVLFSAKEAVYKAVYPRLRRWIDFTEVAVAIEAENGRFRARPAACDSDLALLESGEGSFRFHGDAILTVFHLPQ